MVRFRSFVYFFDQNVWFIFPFLLSLLCLIRFHDIFVWVFMFRSFIHAIFFFPKICLVTANFFVVWFLRSRFSSCVALRGWWIIFNLSRLHISLFCFPFGVRHVFFYDSSCHHQVRLDASLFLEHHRVFFFCWPATSSFFWFDLLLFLNISLLNGWSFRG